MFFEWKTIKIHHSELHLQNNFFHLKSFDEKYDTKVTLCQ